MVSGDDVNAEARFDDVVYKFWSRTEDGVDIPYRMLLPKKIDNLLYAGRCISCTAEAQNLIRGITACWILA